MASSGQRRRRGTGVCGGVSLPPMPSLAHRAEYAALRGAVAVLDRLPWRGALAFGARLGALGYWPLAIRRRVVERQVAAALPELGASEVRRVARGAYEHLGRTAIEVALLPGLGREGVLDLFEGVDGWEHVERAMEEKKGILFVTGHLGNWELAGSYVAARGALGPLIHDGEPTRTAIEAARPLLARTRVRRVAGRVALSVGWLVVAMYGLFLLSVGLALR